MLSFWLADTIQIALVQRIQWVVKESDDLQAGHFLLIWAGLEVQVVITNVLVVKPQEPRRGIKDKGKLKYLIQSTPRDLLMDPSL